MILYFSGSGNSEFVATKIGEVNSDQIVSMNELIKENKQVLFHSETPYVFVVPVYAGRMPKIVEAYIRKMQLSGNESVYFIMTCFETPYESEKYIQKLCKDIGKTLKGFDYVNMPQCYIAMYDVPTHDEAIQIYKDALPKISTIADKIKNKEDFNNKGHGFMMSALVNPIFYPMMVSAKGFHVNQDCSRCGECATVCPLNNITVTRDQVSWDNHCTHCMACINSCPKKAINYKKATKGKTRNYYIGNELFK